MIRTLTIVAALAATVTTASAQNDACKEEMEKSTVAVQEINTLINTEIIALALPDPALADARKKMAVTLDDKLFVLDRGVDRLHAKCGDLGDYAEVNIRKFFRSAKGLQRLLETVDN